MPCDYKQYPPSWKTEIRPSILERAGNKCEWCGVQNGRLIHRYGNGANDWKYWPEGMESEAWSIDGLKSTLVVLTIAHIHNPDKMDCRPENLAALCQKCHLGHDLKHHMENARNTRNRKKQQPDLFP